MLTSSKQRRILFPSSDSPVHSPAPVARPVGAGGVESNSDRTICHVRGQSIPILTLRPVLCLSSTTIRISLPCPSRTMTLSPGRRPKHNNWHPSSLIGEPKKPPPTSLWQFPVGSPQLQGNRSRAYVPGSRAVEGHQPHWLAIAAAIPGSVRLRSFHLSSLGGHL